MLQAGARNRIGLKLPSPAALIHRWLPICPSSSLAGNLTLSSRLAGLTNRIRGEADELSSDLAGDLIKLNASLVTFAYEQRQLPLIPAVAPSRELSADLAGYVLQRERTYSRLQTRSREESSFLRESRAARRDYCSPLAGKIAELAGAVLVFGG